MIMMKELLLILCFLIANQVSVQAQTSYSTSVIDSLKNVHPRLYLDSTGIVNLKAKITAGKYKTLYQSLINKVKYFGVAPTTPITEGPDLRVWGDKLGELTIAYKLSGTASYLKIAENYASYLMTAPSAYYNASANNLEPGHHLIGLSIFYDWCYTEIPLTLRDSIVAFVKARGTVFFTWLKATNNPNTQYYLSNQLSSKMAGLGTSALAFYEAFNTKSWIDLTMQKFIFADSIRGTDGAPIEGPSYGGYDLDFRMRYFDLAKPLLSYNFYTNSDFYYNNSLYQVYTSLPLNKLSGSLNVIDIGDCPRYLWYGPNYILRGLAKERRNGYAQQLADMADTKNINYTNSSLGYNLLRYDSTVISKPLTSLPTLHFFDNIGLVTDRDSWTNNNTAISFICGSALGQKFTKNYTFDCGTGHAHPNANSFSIFSNGEFLIRNCGYNQRRTLYENTLLVDTKGQLDQAITLGYWTATTQATNKLIPTIVKIDSTLDYSLIVGDATSSYNSSLNKYLRTFIYFKTKNVVLVLDTIQSNATHNFELLFHTEKTTDSIIKLDSSYLVKGDFSNMIVNPLCESALLGVKVDTSSLGVINRSGTLGYTDCLIDFKKTDSTWKNAVAFSWDTKKQTPVSVSLVHQEKNQWTFNVGGVLCLYDWNSMTFNAILPIHFVSVSAEFVGNMNRVNWITADEKNVKEFKVERSFNNIDWIQIGTTLSKDGKNLNNYSFIDYTFTSFNYYRIRSIDFDGTTNISKVVSVKNASHQTSVISISPNPTLEGVTIQISVDKAKEIKFVLTDLFGKTIKTKVLNLGNGINNCYISLDNLAKGTYVLSINDGNILITKEIIKQ